MKRIIFGWLLLCGALSSKVIADDDDSFVAFDKALLESRGLSSDVADFFATDKKFYPGDNAVKVIINSSVKKKTTVFFQSDGSLCFNQTLATQLSLKPIFFGDNCAPPLLVQVRYVPDENIVYLTLPTEYIDKASAPAPYETGGSAAMMNYRMYGSVFQSETGSVPSFNADLEFGFNVNNWIFRSSEYANFYQDEWNLSHQEFYLATEVFDKTTLFQVGQLQAKSESYGGLGFDGLQWSNTSYSMQSQQLLIPIEGTVSEQSEIEVSQSGRVVYTTMVPPGPFRIEEITGIILGQNLSVSVKNSQGEVDSFDVPTISEGKASSESTNFSIALGVYDSDNDSEGDGAPVIMGEYQGPFMGGMSYDSAALWLDYQQYLSYTGTLNYSGSLWNGFIKQKYSSTDISSSGWSVDASINTSWWDRRLSAGAAMTKSSQSYKSYSDLDEPINSDEATDDYSYNLSTTLSLEHLGGVSLYKNKSVQYNSDTTTTYGLNYNKSFKAVSLSLSLTSRHYEDEVDDSIYINFQLPLGSGKTASWNSNSTNDQWYHRLSYRNPMDKGQLSMDYSRSDTSDNMSASYGTQTSFGSVSVGGSASDNDTYSSYASLNGGVAFNNKGAIVSPSPIGETFSIVEVKNTSDISLSGGGVKQETNESGLAVISRVPAYRDTLIQISPSSIPDHVKLSSIEKNIQLAYGSVGFHQFEVSHHRSAILSVTTETGDTPKLGAMVSNQEGKYVTTVIGQGLVLLEDEDINFPLFIKLDTQERCRIDSPNPAIPETASGYELSVLCHEQ